MSEYVKQIKNPGPEDQALVSPHRGLSQMEQVKIPNNKYQISNIKQITMTEIQNFKRFYDLEEEKPNLFRSLDIGI